MKVTAIVHFWGLLIYKALSLYFFVIRPKWYPVLMGFKYFKYHLYSLWDIRIKNS